VVRRAFAAYQDAHFGERAERIYGKTVLAHIRRATVGSPSLFNTHPFYWGRWAFAHNGTITAFEKIRGRMESETEPDLLEERRGDTDSELAFYWLLTRLAEAGIGLLAAQPTDLARVMPIVGQSVRQLAN
jgi:glutamine amidotransferase